MNHASEQMQMQFHNKAREIFFSLIHDFDAATSGFDREKEEYRFQRLKNEYSATLKQKLEHVAENILQLYQKEKHSNEMGQYLQQLINEYLHRFLQKANF